MVVTQIAAATLDDGVTFNTATATTEAIRDEDRHQGVRVSLTASLATARLAFHVDVSTGDPVTPPPQAVRLPRILGSQITVRGYPLAMVHAEKIVTTIVRGTTSTRWRDFADLYLLARHHPIYGADLAASIQHVAHHRGTRLAPLDQALDGYGAIGQQRWEAWRRKQRRDDGLPAQFSADLARGRLVIVDLSRGSEEVLQACAARVIRVILGRASERFRRAGRPSQRTPSAARADDS